MFGTQGSPCMLCWKQQIVEIVPGSVAIQRVCKVKMIVVFVVASVEDVSVL